MAITAEMLMNRSVIFCITFLLPRILRAASFPSFPRMIPVNTLQNHGSPICEQGYKDNGSRDQSQKGYASHEVQHISGDSPWKDDREQE